jgi:NitT/TauT family transport system substrate-binding protein
MTVAPVYIAHAAGLYAEQGLDVELVPIEGVASSVPLLLQDKLDVLPGPVSPGLFNAVRRGGRLRIVADKGQYFGDDCAHQILVKSPGFSRRGGQPTRVTTMKEPINRMFVDKALLSQGVRLEAVEQLYLPKVAEYDALVSSRIDAASMSEPWLSRALERGATEWVRANQLMTGHQFSVISYGPRLLDREPDVGRRVALAHLKAMRIYNEGKTERNLKIVGDVLGFAPEELRHMCWPRMPEDGYVNVESLMEFQRWSVERGDLDAVVPPEAFWDPRFVAWANQQLGRTP